MVGLEQVVQSSLEQCVVGWQEEQQVLPGGGQHAGGSSPGGQGHGAGEGEEGEVWGGGRGSPGCQGSRRGPHW